MFVRTTFRCPSCTHVLGVRFGPLFGETRLYEVGPPVTPCPSCGNPVRTGGNYWKDLSRVRKAEALIGPIAYCMLAAPVFSLMVALTVGFFIDFGGSSTTTAFMWLTERGTRTVGVALLLWALQVALAIFVFVRRKRLAG